MTNESLVRLAAVVAAAVLLASPYRERISGWLSTAAKAASDHRATLARIAAAGLIVAAAWGKVPMPSLPAAPAVSVSVETPSVEMQQAVAAVAEACRSMPAGDRALWAATWQKAGVVAAGDAVTGEAVFTDTRSLQMFTRLCLEIAWRRIGQHAPGSNEPLREAVEAAYGAVVGRDVVPVDKAVRDRYVEFAKAIAWAGMNRG